MWNVKSSMQRVVLAMFERRWSEKGRSIPLYLFAVTLPLLLFVGVSSAQYPQYGQYPILDQVANRVIQKYQNSSCEQLWQQRGQPPSSREQEAIQFLRNNPQMQAAFIDRVAAPIANKMFQCGMIP